MLLFALSTKSFTCIDIDSCPNRMRAPRVRIGRAVEVGGFLLLQVRDNEAEV
jgi:hypothetical protein